MAQLSGEVVFSLARSLLRQMEEAAGQSTNSTSSFLLPEFRGSTPTPQQLWAELASFSEPPMEEALGSNNQAERLMICYGSLLPTRIPERLSVNLGLSLELQTEAVIGHRSKVGQLSCSPEFPLPTQTMG